VRLITPRDIGVDIGVESVDGDVDAVVSRLITPREMGAEVVELSIDELSVVDVSLRI
jgi:hypothetical protein